MQRWIFEFWAAICGEISDSWREKQEREEPKRRDRRGGKRRSTTDIKSRDLCLARRITIKEQKIALYAFFVFFNLTENTSYLGWFYPCSSNQSPWNLSLENIFELALESLESLEPCPHFSTNPSSACGSSLQLRLIAGAPAQLQGISDLSCPCWGWGWAICILTKCTKLIQRLSSSGFGAWDLLFPGDPAALLLLNMYPFDLFIGLFFNPTPWLLDYSEPIVSK